MSEANYYDVFMGGVLVATHVRTKEVAAILDLKPENLRTKIAGLDIGNKIIVKGYDIKRVEPVYTTRNKKNTDIDAGWAREWDKVTRAFRNIGKASK